jgi:hypothetical protein
MFMSHEPNAGQNHYMKIGDKSIACAAKDV